MTLHLGFMTVWSERSGLLSVRFLRWGFLIKDTRRFRLLFSERYGYQKGYHFGPFYVRKHKVL